MFGFRNYFFGRSLFVNIFSLDLILIQLRSVCCKHDTGVPYFAAAASLLLFSLLLVFATSAGIITRRDCSFTRLMVNLRKCRLERASQSQKASKRIGSLVIAEPLAPRCEPRLFGIHAVILTLEKSFSSF